MKKQAFVRVYSSSVIFFFFRGIRLSSECRLLGMTREFSERTVAG